MGNTNRAIGDAVSPEAGVAAAITVWFIGT
jgi:hypothetical protein